MDPSGGHLWRGVGAAGEYTRRPPLLSRSAILNVVRSVDAAWQDGLTLVPAQAETCGSRRGRHEW